MIDDYTKELLILENTPLFHSPMIFIGKRKKENDFKAEKAGDYR